ncbi:DUF4139 domain-containing protein [Loktanella sp. S4079]|uniref:DUF4139 domain-containing protein n=1 Tax=Loktanella sp. S4079 TaxID=579483 RepID=UPI0005FA8F34|nr:DUF4139 domain-containing protein [Loktanella sp. S4079]KJZ19086.1 hypothetical protein TW80_09770 [Loktanella sp. S4079]
MYRSLLMTSFIALSAPAFADTFTVQARVDAVTIYPGLANVTRQVTLELPEGQHEIIVAGLPEQLATEGLRISAPDEVQLGAVNLAKGRLPVTPDLTTPEVQAAKDEVERLEEQLRQRNAEIDQIRLRIAAAEEQIAFLRGLSQATAGEALTAQSIADIRALAQMVGDETLAARQSGFDAEQEAQAAERAREDDQEALDEARRRLDALIAPEQQGSVLTFTVLAAEAGDFAIDLSTYEGFANWSPVYDMRLTTGDAPTLGIDRSVVISQASGQDWNDVTLTLSTARPREQIAPSGVWAPLRRIVSEEDLERAKTLFRSQDAPAIAEAMASPAVPAPEFRAQADLSGAAVTYRYPGRVTVRNGVEDLRLPLDRITLDADIWAEAAPSRDHIAYRMAEFSNTTQETLLPGTAMLFVDGTMIGGSHLPLIAAGADQTMGFGPLDGILLSRVVPNRSEGDRGVFSSSNQLTEEAIITLENVTNRDWKILLRDAVPYSEQDDLQLEITAQPTVTRVNPDGQRGILEWDLQLGAGETEEVRLDYTFTWPSGYVLQ